MPVARLLYTLALTLALPLMPVWLLWRSRLDPAYRRDWAERFLGNAPVSSASDGRKVTIWVHAVSVGETRAAQPLIEGLLARDPSLQIIISHTTPTGRQTSERLFGDRVTRCYLPYDLPWAVDRFLARTRPALGLLMETELWPNLIAACRKRAIPTALVNGRLSARSAAGYRRVAALTTPTLRSLSCVIAQTEADAERFRALGGRHIAVAGNLKFDAEPDPVLQQRGHRWRSVMGPGPVWLAASTREGEDTAILDTVLALPSAVRLIWAPRHPHRCDAIERAIRERGLSLCRRSCDHWPDPNARVLLADTLGEMAAHIAAADVVFVGGSMVPLGGQNLLEACAQGRPVLVGPHTFNFADDTAGAIAVGAARQVSDTADLVAALAEWLKAPLSGTPSRNSAGLAARHFWKQHRGATQRTLATLGSLIPSSGLAKDLAIGAEKPTDHHR